MFGRSPGRLASTSGSAGLIALALLAVIAAAPRPVSAHIVSGAEVVLLQALPAGVVAQAAVTPDSAGFVPPNTKGAWIHVEHQWPGLLAFMDACVRADSAAAERTWNVIETAMRYQRPDGDYEPVLEHRTEHLRRSAWWIGQLCRAEIIVTNSPLQQRFRWRVTLLMPKLRRSVDWVVAAGDELLRLDAARPDLLMVDATIFRLADGTFHEQRFAELAQNALVAALAGQKPDGAFVKSPREVAQHARAMVGLLELVTFFPMSTLEDATARGAAWLAKHLPAVPKPSRAGMSIADAELWRNALMVLGYQAVRTKDAALMSRVEKLARALGPEVMSGK